MSVEEPRALSLEELGSLSGLIKECEGFAESARTSMAVPFAAFERVRQWRAKRRESRAMEAYELLLPRIRTAEVSWMCLRCVPLLMSSV